MVSGLLRDAQARKNAAESIAINNSGLDSGLDSGLPMI
jgi:hypothetical protein